MDNLTIAAVSGLRSRMESLDLLAHNLANTTTTGFKAEKEMYRQYVAEEAAEGRPMEAPVVEGRWTDFSQGMIQPTGKPLDFALAGRGFFVVNTKPDEQVYTRDGSFKISRDGRLETRDGYEVQVRTPDQKPIRLNAQLDVEISSTGEIRQAKQLIGTLRVIDFATGSPHEKLTGNYFSFTSPQPIDIQNPDIRQGHLEQSNVPGPEMGVRLVNVMRQFEMLQRALQLGAEMNRKSAEEVAKVNG